MNRYPPPAAVIARTGYVKGSLIKEVKVAASCRFCLLKEVRGYELSQGEKKREELFVYI
jgi:hypothetical protein